MQEKNLRLTIKQTAIMIFAPPNPDFKSNWNDGGAVL